MTEGLFVTGASGFIGSHLLKRLAESPFEFINCLSRRKDQPLSLSPGEKISLHSGRCMRRRDICAVFDRM